MYYYGFKPYVSVAKRRANALRVINKLKQKGMDIHPIEIEKRKITRTFWGNAWCSHIESFSDYANRLPRGRSCVRHGAVCHLDISKGHVEALVSGSMLYQVRIQISTLPNKQWKGIKQDCAGKIGSLLELLSGKLSDSIMHVVCHHNDGLFPQSKDIKLTCDCPDWATMCKHVAAVLYGVGARLDHSPEKLFELRGVNHDELIDTSAIVTETIQGTGSRRRRIDHSAIADVFDIDISDTAQTTAAKTRSHLKATDVKRDKAPKYYSGASIRKKRKQLNLSQTAFARRLGVSAGTISNWERKGQSKINLRNDVENALRGL